MFSVISYSRRSSCACQRKELRSSASAQNDSRYTVCISITFSRGLCLKMLQIWGPELDYLILDKYTSSTFIHVIKQQFRKDYGGEWSKSCRVFFLNTTKSCSYICNAK
jgi:hypothetical protein